MEPLIAIVVVWGLCGVTCAIIADSRGRSVPGWLVLGFLLGVFGLILVIVLPPIKAPVAPVEPQGYAVVEPIGADHGRVVSVHRASIWTPAAMALARVITYLTDQGSVAYG